MSIASWTGCCTRCSRDGVKVAPRRQHGERVLCDLCASRPSRPPRVTPADPLLDETPKRRNGRRPTTTATSTGNAATPEEAKDELTRLLGLEAIGVKITGATLFGRGSLAVAHLQLSDRSKVVLDPLGRFASPAKLTVELALQAGASPSLKMPQVTRAMVLLHKLAEHQDTLNADDRATDWGISFLQAAQVAPVRMSDQADRWRAFEHLDRIDPVSNARADSTSIAIASVVIVDQDSAARYVRASWFAAYVRQQAGPGAADEASRAMRRVGWEKPGTEGRVKATAPGRGATLQWAFYRVPAGWESQ
jgi:hypothetical protein